MLALKPLSITSLLGAIIETFVSIVVDARPSVEDSLPYVNMCDGTDVILNKESSLSLKVIVVDIFICVLNTWLSSNVGNTQCVPYLKPRDNDNDCSFAD